MNVSPRIGRERAERAAQALDAQAARGESTPFLIGVHRDYCGHGLFLLDGQYTLAKSEVDGWPTDPLVSFPDRDAFIEWLSARTDTELAGQAGGVLASAEAGPPDNQRLSCARLDALIERLA